MPTLKMKVLPKFPSRVIAGDGITITKASGVYTFSINANYAPSFDNGLPFTAGDVLVADGAASVTGIHDVAAGNVFLSGGVGAVPSWGKVAGAHIRMGSDARGDILYFNGTDYARLPAGASGYLLKSNGAGADPAWVNLVSIGERNQVSTAVTLYTGTTPVTVTISNASPGVVTWTTHGRLANDPVAFATSGALPTGLTAGTVYYVKTVQGVNTFTVSATPGGAEINTSSAGSGTHQAWTGNDTTGTGATDNPFMTLQQAWNYAISNYDTRGVFITLQVRSGHIRDSYALAASGLHVGQQSTSRIAVVGDTVTPSNRILEGTTCAVLASQFANFTLSGFKLQGATGLDVNQFSAVVYDHIDWGVCSVCHYAGSKYGYIFDGGNITISGASPFHAQLNDFAYAAETTGTTNFTAAVNFSGAYVNCNQGASFVQHTNKTYTGTAATGKRFNAASGSLIGADTLTFLPGDAVGTTDDSSAFSANNGSWLGSYPIRKVLTPTEITWYNASGKFLFEVLNTSSAVNGFELAPSATGNNVFIRPIGDDTNIILDLRGKGTGGAAVLGTSTNNNAATGYVGEYVESIVATGSAVSLTHATPANITSISLTAGDWDVRGTIHLKAAATTNISFADASISTTSATTSQASGTYASLSGDSGGIVPGVNCNPSLHVVPTRISVSATTTVYLVAQVNFSVSTLSGFGQISARRVR